MNQSLIKEIAAIIAVSAALGIGYNFFRAEPLSLWRSAKSDKVVSDSVLFSTNVTSVTEGATTTSDHPDSAEPAVRPADDSLAAAVGGPNEEPPDNDQIAADTVEKTSGDVEETHPQEDAPEMTTAPVDTVAEQVPAKTVEKSAHDGNSDDILNVLYDQVQRLVSNPDVQFVDARRADEFEEGVIGNAVNIYPPEFEDHIPLFIGWPRDKVIVVYCGGGTCELSHELAERLMEFDFTKVFVYKGGYSEWTAKQGQQ